MKIALVRSRRAGQAAMPGAIWNVDHVAGPDPIGGSQGSERTWPCADPTARRTGRAFDRPWPAGAGARGNFYCCR
jgi:hypothetical protein